MRKNNQEQLTEPEIQKLLQGISDNSAEVDTELTLIKTDPINAELYRGGAISILAGKLVRRVILAAQTGAKEEEIVSAVENGFKQLQPK